MAQSLERCHRMHIKIFITVKFCHVVLIFFVFSYFVFYFLPIGTVTGPRMEKVFCPKGRE